MATSSEAPPAAADRRDDVEEVPKKLNIVRFLMDRHGTKHSNTYRKTGNYDALDAPKTSANAASSAAEEQEGGIKLTRKTVQELLKCGAVTLNGNVVNDAEGVFVDPGVDSVIVAPDALEKLRARIRVWVYDKPEGVDCNMTAKDPASILHVLKESKLSDEGAFPVGRLDKDSCGMLLLTNSGALCERLLHPAFAHEKEYLVHTNQQEGSLHAEFFEHMRNGVSWYVKGGEQQTSEPCQVLPYPAGEVRPEDDGDRAIASLPPIRSVDSTSRKRKADAAAARGAAFRISIQQGLNRQIRQMVTAAGRKVKEAEPSTAQEGGDGGRRDNNRYDVVRLRRVRTGPLWMPNIAAEPSQVLRDCGFAEVSGEPLSQLVQWAFGGA